MFLGRQFLMGGLEVGMQSQKVKNFVRIVKSVKFHKMYNFEKSQNSSMESKKSQNFYERKSAKSNFSRKYKSNESKIFQ